jgi:SAM-dependent methyltransferase
MVWLIGMKSQKREWYVNIFNGMGSDWEAIVNMRDTVKEVTFIRTAISKRGVILDLCCGTGRHSVILCRSGVNVIGMDLSRNLLMIARRRMSESGFEFPVVRADMRHFPFKNEVFSAIINMFTSFGYLPSESEDEKSLLEIFRTLRKNGRFLLDVANRDHIVRNFRERDWAEFEPYYLLERRALDLEDSRLVSQWTLVRKDRGKTKSIIHEVRLYTLTRIEQLLRRAGLVIEEVYGGYEKQEFNLEASRMIVLAQKR